MQALETIRSEKTLLALILAAIMAFALMAGCAAEEQESSEAGSESSSEQASETAPAVEGLAIGNNSGSSRSLVVVNETGADITFISIATVGSQDEPEALAIPGGKWASGETATIFYGKGDVRSTYEVTITANDVFYTLHNLTLSSIDQASLRVDGTFAYLTYNAGGTTVSTLGTEKGIAAMAAGQNEQPAPTVVTEDTDSQDEYYDYYWDEDEEDTDDEDGEDTDEESDETTDDETTDDEYTDDEYTEDEYTDDTYDEGEYTEDEYVEE